MPRRRSPFPVATIIFALVAGVFSVAAFVVFARAFPRAFWSAFAVVIVLGIVAAESARRS